MRRLAPLLVVAILVAGCGEREETLKPERTERIDLAVKVPSASEAGIFAAIARERFSAAGLEVRVVRSQDPAADVDAGRADLAILPEPELLEARDGGRPLTAVAALVRRPLASLAFLPSSGIRNPSGLRDKRVGTHGTGHERAFLETIVEVSRAGAAEQVTVRGALIDALLEQKATTVDAVLGILLNYEGVDPRLVRQDATVRPVDQAGVPTYAEVLVVAREDALESEAGEIRGFLGAVARGTRDLASARARAEAVAALADANRSVPKAVHRAGVDRTVPLLGTPRGRPFGYLEPRERRAFARYLRDSEVVERTPSGTYTNGLLPGRGLP